MSPAAAPSRPVRRCCAILAAALLTAAAPPPPGTVSVEPATGDVPPAVARVFADAVGSALSQADFVPLPPPGRGRYRVRLHVVREDRGTVTTTEPRVRTAGWAGNWGAGVQVALPSRKTALRTLYATRLTVTLLRRADDAEVWSGRAMTVQTEGTRADQPDALAAKLAQAIVAHYPAQSDETAAVP